MDLNSENKKEYSQGVTVPNVTAEASEKTSFRSELPQVYAAIAAGLSETCVGLALAFSAVLIPQILQEQANHSENAIQITKEESTYIASMLVLVVIPSALIGGFLMDAFGRLAVIKIGTVPTIIGWFLVALSSNKWMLICGRCLSGSVAGLYSTSVIIYIAETSSPKYRGALMSLGPLSASLGMLGVYVIGRYLHWRTFAWFGVGYTLVPLVLVMFLPESPSWLVSKSRLEQARKSLQWLRKRKLQSKGMVEDELSALVEEQVAKKQDVRQKKNLKMFLEPAVYKPLLIIAGLCVIQQFSGSYIVLMYSVTFMESVGTKINPYTASMLIGGTRLGMSVVTVWLLRYCKRRTLLFTGLGGMASTMGLSALYTRWILEGTTTHNWIPGVMIPLYILFAVLSVLSIPFTFTGELFPLEARGVLQSISFVIMHLLMFLAVENYYKLNSFFGGASGIQFFFGSVALLGLVFSYIFIPETHGKKLSEIEDYFTQHNTYFSVPQNDQNENLLNVTKISSK